MGTHNYTVISTYTHVKELQAHYILHGLQRAISPASSAPTL